MTPVHQGDGSMSSQATPPPLPTSQALKVFMTEFERDEELNLTDDVKHVEGDRVAGLKVLHAAVVFQRYCKGQHLAFPRRQY